MKKIERIEMPAADVFYREYMCNVKPVVITNFFAGERIREIDSREKVITHLGDALIQVKLEYGAAYEDSVKNNEAFSEANEPTRTMSIAEYYAFVDQNPNTKAMCIEGPSPEQLERTFEVPEVCNARGDESRKFVSQCFVGNRGNHANIHFDKAGLHGFLYQVFGKKRFITFPHSASAKLAPFTQLGGWNLFNFSDADRNAFLEFTGGQEVILDTGDCFYVPTLSWHYVDYIEDSMSVSLRFRRSKAVTALVNALFPDMYMQGIADKFASPESARKHAWALREIESAAANASLDGVAHVKHMRALAREIHAALYPEMPRGRYVLDMETHFPPPLPHFLDARHSERPRYE